MTPMRTLLAVSTLCAAALCAITFPEMKKTLAAIPFLLLALAFVAGCSSPRFQKHLLALPDGEMTNFAFQETGKFTNTKLEGEALRKDGGTIVATKVHGQHSNAWVPNLEFKADTWTLKVKESAPAKLPTFAETKTPAAPLK